MTAMGPRFSPLEYPLSFVVPDRLTEVASWHEHAPFAFALMAVLRPRSFVELGTHRGDSYSVFCQAVVALSLETRCTAVDTWRGDEHSGFYGDEVLEELRAYHDPRFGGFSRLLRSTFDDACREFDDASIELLHIDGLHTEEAVRHDFERWRPKLGSRAVVLFHDTNVRERGFGVWRFWSDVSTRYPSFEFLHGNGLGVLAVGRDVPAELLALCGAEADERRRVAELYAALGARVLLAGRTNQQARRIAALEGAVEEQGRDIAELRRTIADREGELAQRAATIAEQERRLEERDRLVREQDARLREIDARLQDVTEELRRVTSSRSWRLSAPLRRAAGVARRVRHEGPRALLTMLPRDRARPSAIRDAERAILAGGAFNRAWYGGCQLDAADAGRQNAQLEATVARIDAEDTRAIVALTQQGAGGASTHGGAPSVTVRSLAPLEEIERFLARVTPDHVPARADAEPSFTIVTPFFRHRKLFDECAASVEALRQASDGLALEWLVVNDDPDQDEAELARAMPSGLRASTRIVSDGRRRGIVHRLNQGIEEARHEWILFLDCDDLIHSNALVVLRRWIERFPRCRYISSAMVDIDEEGRVLRYRRRTSGPARLLSEGMTAGHLKAIRRDAFEHHGLLEDGFPGCQDYEFALRMAFEEPLLYVPQYLYSYRWHGATQSVSRAAQQTATADAVVRKYALRYLRSATGSATGGATAAVHGDGGSMPRTAAVHGDGGSMPRRAAAIVRTQGRRPALLLEAVESLRLQTLPVQAVVVVHGDEDAVARVRATVADARGDVVVLHASDVRRRRGHPLNVGLRHVYHSTAEVGFAFFLDDDDIVYPMFAERMYEAFLATGADVVHAASNRRVPGRAAEHGYAPLPAPCLLVDNFIPINAYAIRVRSAREKQLAFDENLEVLEDWSFLIRALGAGLDFHALRDTLSEFRIIGDGNRPRKDRPEVWAACREAIGVEIERACRSLDRAVLLERLLTFPGDAIEALGEAQRRLIAETRRFIDRKWASVDASSTAAQERHATAT